MYVSWSKGTWTAKGNTIYFKPIPIYDTLVIYDSLMIPKDSLMLSSDEKPERLRVGGPKTFSLWDVKQNGMKCPRKVVYRKERLYLIKNDRLQKKKIDNGFYINPFEPWYTKLKNG